MKVLVYQGGEDVPLAIRCAARFLLEKGKLHPVVIHASTPEAAHKAATEWWNAEVQKEQDKRNAAEARDEARRQRKAGVPVNEPKPEGWDEEEVI